MTFEELEKIRTAYYEKTKQIYKKCLYISGGIILLIALILILSGAYSAIGIIFNLIFFAFIVSVIIASINTSKLSESYQKAYKDYFVTQSLAKVFTNLQYNHEAGISKETLSSTGMINTGDRYYSNDLVSGKYKDVGFIQADVDIQEEHTDSDGGTYYVTIFRGRWMIFEFPKKFNFKLEIIGKRAGAARKPSKNASATGRKFEKIEVESPEFNKNFTVYSEDGFETFYILDPAFIDKIEKIGASCNNEMLMCFLNNKLYIGLNDGKDSFEPPKYNKPINEQEEFAKVTTDINVITNFVEGLDLDDKLFN